MIRFVFYRPILNLKIQHTMFSLASGKAPGPDGFCVDFFKYTWDIVGPSVILAVKDFFCSSELLREINNTIIALVPKHPNATAVNDYRFIACCNTIYKCITKILANRLASILPTIVSPPQNAFIKGRHICDNILLAHELFSGFHLEPYLPKCVVKVDFQKAYDIIDWDFLELALQAFGFPTEVIKLVMICIRTPKFIVSINGELHGFFQVEGAYDKGIPCYPTYSHLLLRYSQVF